MAWQLIFTSVPRGLVAGRSGFCTVARHPEIRDRVVTELERLSDFDRKNGPIASHRILDIAGSHYHILSRIQDAGLDYSGRPVHIAHHIVANETEIRNAVSPAQLLRCFPWCTRWDEPPRFFTDAERVHLTDCGERLPSGQWQQTTGNAAHTVLLTEPEAARGCWILRAPGAEEQLLTLFEESLDLLGDRLWHIRFTTAFQSSDQPTDFDWRGCPALPASARSEPVFDLRHPLTLPAPHTVTTPTQSRAPASVLVEREPTFSALRHSAPESIRVEAERPDEQRRARRLKTIVISIVVALSLFLLFLAVKAIRML